MPTKTGYIAKEKKYNEHEDTSFESKWGIRADKLAEQEDVAVATIHMRVMNYGTPFQRRKNPTRSEVLHKKTLYELACEIGVHPIWVQQRIQQYGDAYTLKGSAREMLRNDTNWRTGKFKEQKHWLMEEHPDYDTFFNV